MSINGAQGGGGLCVGIRYKGRLDRLGLFSVKWQRLRGDLWIMGETLTVT